MQNNDQIRPSDRRATPMKFVELSTGCFVCVSHEHNKDGYLRKTWAKGGRKETEMFHRFIFRAHNKLDKIPPGFEVDHMCGIRACCNPSHLRMIDRKSHLIETNEERYRERHNAAWWTWRNLGCTGTALGELFGVSGSRACGWIREWKQIEREREATL